MDKQKGFIEESLAGSQNGDVCRALFYDSPDAILLGDPETGIILDANPAASRLLGRPIHELIGLHQNALHPPKSESASRRIFIEHSASDVRMVSSGPEEHYALRADGAEIPIEITDKVIKIKGRKVLQVFFRDISERKRAESALLESETKFKTLTEKSTVGVYLIQDGLFKYVNPAMSSIFGYTPEELINKLGPEDLVLADDQPTVDENLRKRLDGEARTINYGFRGTKKTGEVIYAEVFGTRIEYLGRPAVIGTLLDESGRRNALEALRESEQRYRNLVNYVPVGIAVHRLGKIKFVNKKLAELGGARDTYFIGRSVLDFVHPDYRELVRDRLRSVIAGGAPLPPIEEKLLSLDGSVLDMEMHSLPITYEGEDCTMSIVQDITAFKREQQALRESEELYRTLVNHAPAGIVVHAMGVMRYANSRMMELVRVAEPARLIGHSVMEFMHADYKGLVSERIRRVMENGETLPPAEEKLIAADGTKVDVEISSVPITYLGEACAMAIVRDITPRKRAEAEIESAHEQLLKANTDLEKRVDERTTQLAELNKELEAFS